MYNKSDYTDDKRIQVYHGEYYGTGMEALYV